MSDFFQKIIKEIEAFYQEYNYQLGWRFLNCSKTVLKNNPQIAFITLNPGGDRIPPDHPWASCEKGSSYLYEKWGNARTGKHNLQIQIQLLFSKIVEATKYNLTSADLIEETLSGYFVPFRSPRLADLEYKTEAFSFAVNIWSKMLSFIQPTRFICIDRETYKRLRPIIIKTYGLPELKTQTLFTGWGKITADIVEFGKKSEVKLLRLPHLSIYKLFTRTECERPVNHIFKKFFG